MTTNLFHVRQDHKGLTSSEWGSTSTGSSETCLGTKPSQVGERQRTGSTRVKVEAHRGVCQGTGPDGSRRKGKVDPLLSGRSYQGSGRCLRHLARFDVSNSYMYDGNKETSTVVCCPERTIDHRERVVVLREVTPPQVVRSLTYGN